MPRGRGKSIVNDLKDFLREHIVPLKKGEVVRGEPIKVCLKCKKKSGCALVGNYQGDKLCLKTLVIIK